MPKQITLTDPKNGKKMTLTQPSPQPAPENYQGIDMYKLADQQAPQKAPMLRVPKSPKAT